jgi:hypothetical protein
MTAPTLTAGETTGNRPIVGAYGDVYTAPIGTAPPTDLSTISAPWILLGLVSEDGATWTPPTEETTDIGAWQTPYPVRIVTTSLTTSVNFALMQWDRNTVPFALGGGTFEDSADTVIFHPPAAGESVERALFIKVLDEPVAMGIYYAKGRVSEREDAVFKRDEAALLNVTFAIVGDMNSEPYNLIFDSDTFPSGVVATGATAGTPGTFSPVGAQPPASLAALQGGSVTATPATAWTTGQHVVLGDASKAFWTSSAWSSGQAAVTGQQEAPSNGTPAPPKP